MSGFTEEIAPGTVVQRIVGMPGPDCDMAIVTKCYGPGQHQIMYQVYGDGPFFFGDVKGHLWPDPMFPGQWSEPQAEKLRAEYRTRADLCADPALLAEAVEVLRDAVAAWELHNKTGDMMQGHWAGDARLFLNKLENRHD